jgi:hypothetical protein
MTEAIDRAVAITVQDLANELKVYRRAAANNRDVPPWPRFVWSLWSKTFVRSAGSRAHPKSPPMPEDLVAQVTDLDSFRAVVVVVGRARAEVSGRGVDVEIAYVDENTRRFLETLEGKDRQKYLDDHPTP